MLWFTGCKPITIVANSTIIFQFTQTEQYDMHKKFMDCVAQSMDLRLICTLRGQSVDWTNLAWSVDCATICVHITFNSHLAGHAWLVWLDCACVQHMHWDYQRRNQARTLPVSFVVKKHLFMLIIMYQTYHTKVCMELQVKFCGSDQGRHLCSNIKIMLYLNF